MGDGPVEMKEFDQEKDDEKYAKGLHDWQFHCNKQADEQAAAGAAGAAGAADAAGAAASKLRKSDGENLAAACLTMFNGVCSHLQGSKAYHCENFKNAMFKMQKEAAAPNALVVTADNLKEMCPKSETTPDAANGTGGAHQSSLLQSL